MASPVEVGVGWQPSDRQRDRDRYRSRRTARSLTVGLLTAAAVAAVVVVVVGRSSGWKATQQSFFDFRAGWRQLPTLLRALWINVQIMLITEVLVLVFAALIAIARTLPGPGFLPLRFLAALYTDVFRGLPLLLVLILVGYGIPSLRLSGTPQSYIVLSIIALTLTYTSYVAEVFRAGIQSIHPSQRASARALGLTYGQAMRYVVFPQAVRRVLPPLLNDFVSLQKDTSLVAFLGVTDMVLAAQNAEAQDYKFVYQVIAGLIFLAFTVPLTRLTDWVARRQGWVGTSMIV